ncbi:MAG: tetratricopeptide repeat protein, partial [Myxococcota bacterium]|nr:tetratricopeptide repeat protein [Myxococcota bacterium]
MANQVQWIPPALALSAALALGATVLVAAGQPLVTDDAWLHWALGRAYANQGPWLNADPLLAQALGPPTPAAWLFDLALFHLEQQTGFAGLRVYHVIAVLIILIFGWLNLRRAGANLPMASLGLIVFISLSAYRLIQLRPHLFTIAAALVLYALVIDRNARPHLGKSALAVLLLGLWANLHAAFLLGLLMIGAATLGLLIAGLIRGHPLDFESDRLRLTHLIGIGLLGGLATLLNPTGLEPHLAWFIAGGDTPSLARVGDEWAPFTAFAFPLIGLPPSLFSWGLQWILMLGTAIVGVLSIQGWARRQTEDASQHLTDPALVALSILALILPFVAVRFLWLGFFPFLLLVQTETVMRSDHQRSSAPQMWSITAICIACVAAFFTAGPWLMMRGSVPNSWASYQRPYPGGKYHAQLIWMAQDAKIEGTGFAEYHLASFAGAHLAPPIKMLINGTLNVAPDVMAANLPLRQRRGQASEDTFAELLDRHQIDFYFGIRLPQAPPNARPTFNTTSHLEGVPGWIPVFRNLTGSVSMRTHPRNQENLKRIAQWYAEQDVPFDPQIGFDVESTIRENRTWAINHGVIPLHFDQMNRAAYGVNRPTRTRVRANLASIYAALGLYGRAIEVDRMILSEDENAIRARRRLAWSLLRAGQYREAVEVSRTLAQQPAFDRLSRQIAETAENVSREPDSEVRASMVANLPVFDALDVPGITTQIVLPPARELPEAQA